MPDEKSHKVGLTPKVTVKADRDNSSIQLDSETHLLAFHRRRTYKLGNRPALEWIIDQFKEKTPKDPTVREKFNTYRFAAHNEKVIDLLLRVTRVSIETMEIVEAMRQANHYGCDAKVFVGESRDLGKQQAERRFVGNPEPEIVAEVPQRLARAMAQTTLGSSSARSRGNGHSLGPLGYPFSSGIDL